MEKTVANPLSLILICFLTLSIFASCSQTKEVEADRESISQNEQLDINLPAMYTGTLPCAGCPGIYYRLVIEEDRFVEISHYQDRPSEPFEETGSWKISEDTLTLTQPEDENFYKRFLVDEDTLTLLDSKNQQITTDLADMYVLERTGNQPSIREHHQKLAEQGFKFFAGGNEPFWSIKIDSENTLIYETPESTKQFGKADSSKTENRITLMASTDSTHITIQANDTFCQDSMSGYLFPREVKIIIQTKNKDTLTGCGLFLNG